MRRYVRPIRRAAAPLGPGPIRLLSPVYKYNPGALFRGNGIFFRAELNDANNREITALQWSAPLAE
jgi:hypothetical protein